MNARLVLLVDGKLIILSPKTEVSSCKYQVICSRNFTGSACVLLRQVLNNIGRLTQQELEDERVGDVHYELDVLAERAEYYWIQSKRLGNLDTSIWAVDGKGIKVSLVNNLDISLR
jgi:hypothetical protein